MYLCLIKDVYLCIFYLIMRFVILILFYLLSLSTSAQSELSLAGEWAVGFDTGDDFGVRRWGETGLSV